MLSDQDEKPAAGRIFSPRSPHNHRLHIKVKVRFVGLPRQPVHSGCRIALEREERLPEQIHAEVVEERCELLLLP
jgi:hypothetical protein